MKNTCCVPHCESKRNIVILHHFLKTYVGINKWVKNLNCARLKQLSSEQLHKFFVSHKHFIFYQGATPAIILTNIVEKVIKTVIKIRYIPVALILDQGTSFQSTVNKLKLDTRKKKTILAKENTVGTTRFDLLAEYITSPPILHALKQIGCKEITFQIGGSDIDPGEYEKEGIKLHLYRFKDSIQEDIIKADLVISHAGAGSCLEALDADKPLLVVVNEDLMDNHQLELAEQLQVDGHLYYCTCDTLESTLGAVDFSLLTPFPKPNTSLFVKYLDDVFKVKKCIE